MPIDKMPKDKMPNDLLAFCPDFYRCHLAFCPSHFLAFCPNHEIKLNFRYILIYTGCFFLTVPPKFKNKNIVQPTRIFCTSRISWNRISDWLPIVFHFGTENWEEQFKKPPCISYTNVRLSFVDPK